MFNFLQEIKKDLLKNISWYLYTNFTIVNEISLILNLWKEVITKTFLLGKQSHFFLLFKININ